jgi:arabinofuranosyltransferase
MISLSGLDRKLISNKYLIISSIMVFIFNIVLFYKYLYWNFDDSYIVFRIVHNILNGDGWVYNVGEVYNASTSALNTIAITLLSYFINNIPVSAHVVGAVGVFLTGMMFFHISRDDLGDCLGLIGALFLMKIMAFNSTWGLETHLFIGLVFLFIFFEKRKRSAVWVTLGVITLARPDGALLITLKALWEFFPKKVIPWKGLVLVLFVVTPWVIYSVVTFEQIFPDTLSQKIWQGKSGYWGSGLIYLNGLSAKYIENAGIIEILILLAAIPGVLILVKIRSPFIYLVLLCVLQQIVYVIFNVPFYNWYHAVLYITLN